MPRLLWIALGAALFFGAPVAAATAAPPTLTGEFLGGNAQITAQCSSTGSTIFYTATGTAVGPYPGTFYEAGRIIEGAANLPLFNAGFQAGPITALNAAFLIKSPVGTVTGTKRLLVQPASAVAFCYQIQGGRFVQACACGAWSLSYDATIRTSAGSYRDSGRSDVNVSDVTAPPFVPTNYFNEAFASDLLTPTPITGDDD